MSDERGITGSGVPKGAPLLRVFALILVVTGAVLVGHAFPASATPSPGGTVTVEQTCGGWSVSVDLNHKVAPFRTVEVTSTIPGHPGIIDGHFDSTFGQIWLASGTEHDVSATVSLRISAGTSPVFNASASLIPAEGCAGDTTTSTSSSTTSTSEPCLDKCGPVPATTTTTTLAAHFPQPPTTPTTAVKITVMATTGPAEDLLLAAVGVSMILMGLVACRWSRC